jgi:S-adenosylmethionine:tRNA ribosyltransferase-isomerase
MKLSDFQYELPPELIAQEPLEERTASRLLVVDGNSGELQDQHFHNVLDWLKPEDLLVFNDTRVIPARLFGKKQSGGKVEILVERLLEGNRLLAHVRANKSPKPDSQMVLENEVQVLVLGRQDSLFELEFQSNLTTLEILEKYGHIPLPPYIERSDKKEDRERYQTVFARKPGAVAAPTAGLHFDDDLLSAIKAKGVGTAHVTLHVGAGTFQPVKVENLSEHQMHAEYVEVSQETCDAIRACKKRGGKVIAVGTTTLRSLESASGRKIIEPYKGYTRLFIVPGYSFKAVDILITNFHLPGSTLLMLVSAFAGYENIIQAYQHAVDYRYRFFSYGDAMLLQLKR